MGTASDSGTLPALVKHDLAGQSDDKDGTTPLRMENLAMSLTTSWAAKMTWRSGVLQERGPLSSSTSAEGSCIVARSRKVVPHRAVTCLPPCLDLKSAKSEDEQVLALHLGLKGVEGRGKS